MRELQRKQRNRILLYSFPSLILFIIIAGFLVKGAIRVMMKERESAKQVALLEERYETSVDREQEVKSDIERLKTEEGIKGEIKDRFNVVEEGEYVAVVVDNTRKATSTEDSTVPWYKRIWFAIIGNK